MESKTIAFVFCLLFTVLNIIMSVISKDKVQAQEFLTRSNIWNAALFILIALD